MWHQIPGRFMLAAGVVFALFAVSASGAPQADSVAEGQSADSHVMQSFTSTDQDSTGVIKIEEKRKRQIMFAMGVPLLLFIMTTVALGIAMGVFGKEVYVAHMIFAGLSLTLAMGHAIVGLVWFWPF